MPPRRALPLRWVAAATLAGLAAGRPPSPDREPADQPAPACAADVHGARAQDLADARQRIAALRAEIARHDRLYFQAAAPEISDFAYDQLVRELAELEAASPGAVRVPPAEEPVGDDRTGLFPTWRHRVRMLSLDKTYREAELRAFAVGLAARLGRIDVDFVIEPKVDGVAISAIYEKGRLVRAVTRGNGRDGDDITANIQLIRFLPRELRDVGPGGTPNRIPDLIELRGEIHVTFAEFERANQAREAAGEPSFAHPRNFVAGAIRRLAPTTGGEGWLEVVFYGWGAWKPAATAPATQREFHTQIRAWGLPGLTRYWVARGAEEVWAAVQECGRLRSGFGYPIDGAVVKLDEVALRGRIGESDRAPRWAMAFKYAPERVRTRLRGITVQVGRTGLLTPVAELEPVELAGGLVNRATLHNRQAIARLDLRVGDLVVLERAGGIVPAISAVDVAERSPAARPYVFPASCPDCGAAVAQREGESAVRCPNAACPAQVRQRIRHFASRDCADLGGLGPATIDALVRRGVVTTVADLYRLRPEDLAGVGRGGGASAERLMAALERSKHAPLSRIIHGLSIPRIGAAAARDLARRYGSLEGLAAAGREDLVATAGEAAANSIIAFFREPRNRTLVADLVALGVGPPATIGEADEPPSPAGH